MKTKNLIINKLITYLLYCLKQKISYKNILKIHKNLQNVKNDVKYTQNRCLGYFFIIIYLAQGQARRLNKHAEKRKKSFVFVEIKDRRHFALKHCDARRAVIHVHTRIP